MHSFMNQYLCSSSVYIKNEIAKICKLQPIIFFKSSNTVLRSAMSYHLMVLWWNVKTETHKVKLGSRTEDAFKRLAVWFLKKQSVYGSSIFCLVGVWKEYSITNGKDVNLGICGFGKWVRSYWSTYYLSFALSAYYTNYTVRSYTKEFWILWLHLWLHTWLHHRDIEYG